jgi:hypothetical protein
MSLTHGQLICLKMWYPNLSFTLHDNNEWSDSVWALVDLGYVCLFDNERTTMITLKGLWLLYLERKGLI